MKLTLEALEVLDAIDRKGSFAAAAAAVYRVPSAVTYTVSKLEQDLGVTLFRKEGRRSVLTPAGALLLEQGRELLLLAEQLVENTRRVATGWESCITIAIDTIIKVDVLFAAIKELNLLQQGIEVNVITEVLGGSWEAILDGRADLVIGAPEPPANAQGLCVHQLMTVDWLFAVAVDHPLTQLGRPVTEQDIAAYRTVVVKDSSRELPPVTRRVLSSQAVFRVASMDQKIEAQVAGVGVGFLPLHRIRDLLEQKRLVGLSLAQAVESTPLHLVWKTNNKGKGLQWLVERIRNLPCFQSSDQNA